MLPIIATLIKGLGSSPPNKESGFMIRAEPEKSLGYHREGRNEDEDEGERKGGRETGEQQSL